MNTSTNKVNFFYCINGSSLGGGEIDSIIRTSILGGKIITLNKPSVEINDLLNNFSLNRLNITNFFKVFLKSKSKTEIHLNSFLRDLKYIFLLSILKIIKPNHLKIILEVHSDPKSGFYYNKLIVKILIFIYQLIGFVFIDKIRFVSHRQLKTFKLLAFKPYYIDAPTSFITRSVLSIKKKYNHKKIYDLIFIGRLSSSRILGDTKNKFFLINLLNRISKLNLKILVISEKRELIKSVYKLDNISFIKPSINIQDFLKKTKILLLPSLHEGYSLLAREASLLDCKVITTKVIAPEIQNLNNIFLVDNFEVEKWIKIICLWLSRK